MGFRISVDVDYFDHPKVAKLVAALGPTADVYPLRLWAWCAKYAKDGRILDPAAAEIGIGWVGRGCVKNRLMKALQAAGFIEESSESGVRVVHGWAERTGGELAAYEDKKARMRAAYHDKKGLSLPVSSGRLPDSAGILPPSPFLPRSSSEPSPVPSAEPPPARQQTTREMGENPHDMVTHEMMQHAERAKCPSQPATIRKHVEALLARKDVGSSKLEAYLMSPAARGKTVNDWQDFFRSKQPLKEPPRDPIKRIHADGSSEIV